MNDGIQDQEICATLKFISQVFIGLKVIVIVLFRFFMSEYIFRFFLIIWYELYSEYLVGNEYIIFLSENGLYEIL